MTQYQHYGTNELIARIHELEGKLTSISKKVQSEIDEQATMLNEDCQSYKDEFEGMGYVTEAKTVAEFIEEIDIDSTDFNIGYEQGYMKALQTVLSLIKKS